MTKSANTQGQTKPKELTEEELNAKIALTGNLADLPPGQQMTYYERYCKHLGLDPITRPFDLLTTFEENGAKKTVLYANASCSAQLADKREVTYGKPEMEYSEKLGLLTVRVQAMMSSSIGIRSCWRSGIAHVEGLKGRKLENAIKKAETQAHRRATLALCGVAMPDESEIEDITGASISALTVDQAPQKVVMPTAEEIFNAPRSLPDTPLPAAWTDGSVARELADREIANKINAGLKTIADEIEAEAPKPAEPDPVPALKPTLTASQQKVSDAVMMLYKEHKREKAETLLEIEKFLGRPVKASKDLGDEEAEKVFAHLQTIASDLSAKAKPEQGKTKYGQIGPDKKRIRAHGEEVGNAIDKAIQSLTILNVPFGPLSDSMAELVEREFGRKIENRYALTDEEAQSVLEYLQNRILEKECEKAAEADEV